MLSRVRRSHGDRGAVAILVVLVVLFVGLPASALGLTTFVRTSALDELQQVADASALAGASTIPLADLDYALGFADELAASTTGPSDLDLAPLLDRAGAVQVRPLDNACAAARASARSLAFSGEWALPVATPPAADDGYVQSCAPDATLTGPAGDVPNTGPSAVEGFARVKYFQDLGLVTELSRCVDALPIDLDGLALDLGLPAPVSTVKGLARTLPALLHPGVVVQVRQDVRGPLDQVLRSTGASTQVVTARARRRPKNLVVLPYDDRLLGTRPSEVLASTTDRLRLALEQTATLLEAVPDEVQLSTEVLGRLPLLELDLGLDVTAPTIAGSALRTCAGVVRAVLDDYDDLVSPADANSVEDTIRKAADGEEPLTVVLLGPGATFLDTLQVCLPQLVERDVRLDSRDDDGDGIPNRIELDARLQVQVNSTEVLDGVRCQPGTPGAFRAQLVRQ